MNKHPVILPPYVASCPSTRTDYCSRDGECARAVIDGTGRLTQDYSVEALGPNGERLCFISAAKNRSVPVAEPKVHEAFS